MSHFVCVKGFFLSLYSRISPVLPHKGRRYITNDSLLFLIISAAKKDDFCKKKSDLETLK